MKVYHAISAVQAELARSGISKDSENTFDKYKFRGIDAIYNALAPLLAKHGLCILPRMVSRLCEERQSQKGGALFYVTVEAEFDLVSAEDGSKHTVRTFGEAMDRGDKATNKAMSAAYKYAAFQTFAIPTEGDNDADSHTHEVQPRQRTGVVQDVLAASAPLGEAREDELRELALTVTDDLAAYGAQAGFERIESAALDDTAKMFLWSLLDSKARSAIKAYSTQLHSKKAA